jgi:chorismate mutase/prephenate dehydratase
MGKSRSDSQNTELLKLRTDIDRIDGEILEALNRRAEVVLQVAKLKRDMKSKFYVPNREQEVINRLKKLNKGPFPNDALKPLFREIMSASLSLEEPLKVAFLGPPATFTHLAGLRHFGSSVYFSPYSSVRGVFEAVDTGKAEFGIVPIENSNEGIVSHTLDMFMDYELKINAEVMLEVSHNLLSRSGEVKNIKKIYSHPQAAAQCRGWLEKNLPAIPVMEAASTAKAAELASSRGEVAAIASELAAKMYDLHFVERHVEDSRRNVTRFLVIAEDSPPRSGNDKTSIMFSVKDRPGALFDILTPFKRAKINLTKIESRPSKRKAWEYIFFVDMEGHVEDRKVMRSIEGMKEGCLFLKVLGSYPAGEE